MTRTTAGAVATAPVRPRVIVVAYHYPPDPAVGSLRARNVAQALAAAGHEVFVVSVARPDAPAEASDGPVRVVRVTPWPSVREVIGRAKKAVSRKKAPKQTDSVERKQAAASGQAWRSPTKVSTIKRWLGAVMWLPDDMHGFIVPAARSAANLMRGDGNDLLYTTAPPFSDLLVGLAALRHRAFRWILEYRDPWTDNIHKPWFVRAKGTDALERWAERKCIERADGVVPVAGIFADILVGRFGTALSNKMLLVRNGIPSAARPTPSDPNRFRIVYAGSFYIRRDPRPFFNALSKINARGGLARKLDVRLVGDCRYFEGEPLAPQIEQLGLTDVVTFVDWLPHKESVQLMASADLLLLLAQDQPYSIPNKVYEYLGSEKRILAVVDEEGETARLLREVGGHFVLNEHSPSDAMERALTEALATPPSTATELSPALVPLTTEAQMKKLTEWIATMHRAS
ncbi:MAG TPA: hypothetical protein VIP11_03085 [Gemmatimonadaceae bacterium]